MRLETAVTRWAVLGCLLAATTLEASGDAVVRLGLGQHALPARAALFVAGGALLFGYGLFLNLAPVDFEKVVGLYIAMLFVVWQIVNYAVFRHVPTVPILAGGVLIVIGGCIVTLWKS
jgi:small multidrug resistance family-3 protein